MSEPDPRFIALRGELLRLGGVVAGAIVSCGWIAFSLNSKATKVALDGEQLRSSTAYDRADDALQAHNGKIRQWEITQAEERAKLATKAEIAPLLEDYAGRRASAVTAGRFWGAMVTVGGLCLAAGALLSKFVGIG